MRAKPFGGSRRRGGRSPPLCERSESEAKHPGEPGSPSPPEIGGGREDEPGGGAPRTPQSAKPPREKRGANGVSEGGRAPPPFSQGWGEHDWRGEPGGGFLSLWERCEKQARAEPEPIWASGASPIE